MACIAEFTYPVNLIILASSFIQVLRRCTNDAICTLEVEIDLLRLDTFPL
jgi:hypothetical protein